LFCADFDEQPSNAGWDGHTEVAGAYAFDTSSYRSPLTSLLVSTTGALPPDRGVDFYKRLPGAAPPYTLAADIRIEQRGSDDADLLQIVDSSHNATFGCTPNGDAFIEESSPTSADYAWRQNVSSPPDGNWYRMTLSVDASSITVEIDGRSGGTHAVGQPFSSSPLVLVGLPYFSGARPWRLRIDNVTFDSK
jgi:hypothetical protein